MTQTFLTLAPHASAVNSRALTFPSTWLVSLLCAACSGPVSIAPPTPVLTPTSAPTRSNTASAPTLPTDAHIDQSIKTILSRQLGVGSDQVHNGATLAELGADSLDIAEIMLALEGEFELNIPQQMCGTLLTVDDTIAYIKTRLHDKKVSAPALPTPTTDAPR